MLFHIPGHQSIYKYIHLSVHIKGVALEFDREITVERQNFIRNFVEAQMVTYEAKDVPGLSSGWFYWTFKME